MILTSHLIAQGVSDGDVRRVRGESSRLRKGVYVGTEADAWQRFSDRCEAVLGVLNPSAALAGPAAAFVWDLPLVGEPPAVVHVRGVTRGSYGPDVVVLGSRLADVTTRNRTRLTTAAWTVADCARLMTRRDALILADAALHAGLCARKELTVMSADCRGLRGAGQLRWVADHASGASESPGESWMRMVALDLGYELLLQVPVHDRGFHARLDALIEGTALVLEFDGLVKYEDRAEAGKVLQAEKERQARIEAMGFIVLRVTWSQLADPGLLDRRIRSALHR